MNRKLQNFLDEGGAVYQRISHPQTFTATDTAESARVAGRELAKTVILRVDGEFVMVVVPATHVVDLQRVRTVTRSETVGIAAEHEFARLFPDCQPGAMPPFGNLYGLRVYVADALADDEEIAFNAGTHDEVVKMTFAHYQRLVRPIIRHVSEPRLVAV